MQPIVLTFLVGLFILGGILVGFYSKGNEKVTDIAIGVAFGVMMGLLSFELLPEAYESLNISTPIKTGAMVFVTAGIGIMLMNILDGFVPHHEHESHHHHKHKDDTCHDNHLNHVGILATVALVIHNIIEGMTLYVTATTSMQAGYLLCVGIGLHNIPMGIVIANTLHTKKETVITGTFLVLSSLIGGIIMSFVSSIVNEFIVGLFICLTIGMLIYISLIELLGQIIHSKNKVASIISVIVGLGIFGISMLLG